MPPKFGDYLFRNLQGQTGAASPTADSQRLEEAAELSEQTLLLGPADFVDSDGGLNWSILNPPEIRIQFRDTQGLMEGRVVVPAGVIRQSYPGLVSVTVKDDRLFLISLKTVVLQLQNCLHSETPDARPTPLAGFDTPIAQIAREDEGFLKLERAVQQDPAPSPASDPEISFPLIREKPQSTPPNPPAVQVMLPSSAVPPPAPGDKRPDPFKDLPKVVVPREQPKPGPRASDSDLLSERSGGRSDISTDVAKMLSSSSDKPLRRLALERLQEIFLTDDYLDARQVAKLLCAYPKVKGALILLEDGTVMGGDLPEDFHMESAFSAPALLRAGREFMQALNRSTAVAITLLANVPVSIFLERTVCILIAHEGRGLLPGMRERISEIAKALDAMYEPSSPE